MTKRVFGAQLLDATCHHKSTEDLNDFFKENSLRELEKFWSWVSFYETTLNHEFGLKLLLGLLFYLQLFPTSMSLRTSSVHFTSLSCSPTTCTCCFPSSRTRNLALRLSRSNTFEHKHISTLRKFVMSLVSAAKWSQHTEALEQIQTERLTKIKINSQTNKWRMSDMHKLERMERQKIQICLFLLFRVEPHFSQLDLDTRSWHGW